MELVSSQAELRRLLDQVRSLDARDVANIVGSAHDTANGDLDGMYAGSLVTKASGSEIDTFFKDAGLKEAGGFHPDYGGAINGDVVRANEYPTGNPTSPCVARNDWWWLVD